MSAAAWLQLIALLPGILKIFNSSTGNILQNVTTYLKSNAGATLLAELDAWGKEMFPTLDAGAHAAAAAIIAATQHSGIIGWLQAGLNIGQTIGWLSFNGEGTTPGTNSPLAVDNIWGPNTKAALAALQAKLGLSPTGIFGEIEMSIINMLTANGGSTNILSVIETIVLKLL